MPRPARLTAAGDAAFERHATTESRGEAAMLAALTAEERVTSPTCSAN